MKQLVFFISAIIGLFTSYAAEPQRIFHDEITQLNDTTIIFDSWPENITYAAIEFRSAPSHNAVQRIVWNYLDSANYHWFDLKTKITQQYGDILDKPSILVTYGITHDATPQVIETLSFDHNDTDDVSAITYALEADALNGKIRLYLGSTETLLFREIDMDTPTILPMGICVHGGKCDLDYLVLESYTDPAHLAQTDWTAEKLRNHFHVNHKDSIEGFWKYLDRDNNPKYARLGGEYQLAIVKNGANYDIIYLNGAQTNGDNWTHGMLKGILTKTAFENHYDLTWHDAQFQTISSECSATLSADKILQLDFPLLKTTMRLVKCATDN